jgi:hypothetical protein
MTISGFPTIVESYMFRERAEALAESLRKHEITAEVIPDRPRPWAVVVPVVQYLAAKRLTRELVD